MSNQASKSFNRWNPRGRTSWAWRVFKKHNAELLKMYSAFDSAHKYVYSTLGRSGAAWGDSPVKHFMFEHNWEAKQFDSLKPWSDSFNELENWITLNALLAITSTFETYIATITMMALESDVGLIFGTSKKIDGIEIIKHGMQNPSSFDASIEALTEGSWQSRVNYYRNLFGKVPRRLERAISDLEKTRILRNNISHAFGRDIAESRRLGEVAIVPITKLRRELLLYYQRVIWRTARVVDAHLFKTHVGEYSSLRFYHKIFPKLNHSVHRHVRAQVLKKRLGLHGDQPAAKEWCRELVEYYEKL